MMWHLKIHRVCHRNMSCLGKQHLSSSVSFYELHFVHTVSLILFLCSDRQEDYKRPDLSTKIGHQPPGENGSWESRTEGDSTYESSAVTGSSYTDTTTNPNERNSRRALILQMAKARMKNVKPGNTSEKTEADVDETVDKTQQQDNSSLAEQAAHLELD